MPVLHTMLSLVQDAGATPTTLRIAVHPIVLGEIIKELQEFGNYSFLGANNMGSDAAIGFRRVAATINDMVDCYMTRDPFAPLDKVYFIPVGEFGLRNWDLGSIDKVIKRQPELGKIQPSEVGTMGLAENQLTQSFNVMDFFNIVEGNMSDTGVRARVWGHVYCNFIALALDQFAVIDLTLPASLVTGIDVY